MSAAAASQDAEFGAVPSVIKMTAFAVFLHYSSYTWMVAGAIVIFLGLYRHLVAPNALTRSRGHERSEKHDSVSEIQPLPYFKWRSEEQLQLRPFKPVFHLTMGISNCEPSELILMDKTYLDRIRLRRSVMHNHAAMALAANPAIVPAVQELYTYMVAEYLPRRYPTMFQVTVTARGRWLRNLVTRELIPLTPPASATTCLYILGSHIDDDMLLLLPEPAGAAEDPAAPKYRLEGYQCCFPSGFRLPEKLGLRIADVHKPVPGYAARLEKSMDRFFATLPDGKVVKRVNWSVQTHGDLYAADRDNHMYEGQEEAVQEDVDFEQTFLRCERQTLKKLPKSGAMVFSFKTYLYPVRQIKEEGLGEELATAVDGLKQGNVPDIAKYKKGTVWGPPLQEYLRS